MGCYGRAIARYPYVFIAVDIILACVSGPIAAWLYGLPDFSDPLKGFEPRGSQIADSRYVSRLIYQQLEDGNLTLLPRHLPGEWNANNSIIAQLLSPGENSDNDEEDVNSKRVFSDGTITDNAASTPRMAVSPIAKKENLFQLSYLRAICDLKKLISSWCVDQCTLTSLPDLITQYSDTSCATITEEDVSNMIKILQDCSSYYFNGQLVPNCNPPRCDTVPPMCTKQNNTIYRIFEQFTDKTFMEENNADKIKLMHSMIFIEWNDTFENLKQFYIDHLHMKDIENNLVKVEGMDLLIASSMLRWQLPQDLVWYGVAMALVIAVLVIYLRSVVLMFTTILNVVFSISLGYWFYFMVCRFNFFPFVNILAGLLLIALGADDLFVFYDLWRDEKKSNPTASHEHLVDTVLHHGGLSVFVTSFTTAAALLANLLNEVTAIRCFGAYASICVMMNFLLFITWVPAILVVIDKTKSCCGNCCSSQGCRSCCDKVSTCNSSFWSKVMPKIVIKPAPMWIIITGCLSVGGMLTVFWKPKLDLPASQNFRLFTESHTFEVYNWQMKDKFRFEDQQGLAKVLIKYTWGVFGDDNGDLLDPDDPGELIFDQEFDLYNRDTQLWLNSACHGLLGQQFINAELSSKSACYWDLYFDYLQDKCSKEYIPGVNRKCCEMDPTSPNISAQCLAEFAFSLTRYHEVNQVSNIIGWPVFGEQDKAQLFFMQIPTNLNWTPKYDDMNLVYQKVSDYIKGYNNGGPPGTTSAWLSGAFDYEFRFYDNQRALAKGTFSGLGVSLAIGFVVLILTTQNILLTIYATITITFVLASTAGTLALMGWELNIAEALTMTLSMGLSIDFTIHLGVAYKISPSDLERKARVESALSTVGSAVTMGALTTLLAGIALIMAQVWAYHQFGTFLVLTITFSWFYSNFLFLTLCSLMGPTGTLGDLRAMCRGKPTSHKHRKESKTPNIMNNPHANPDRIHKSNAISQPSINQDISNSVTPQGSPQMEKSAAVVNSSEPIYCNSREALFGASAYNVQENPVVKSQVLERPRAETQGVFNPGFTSEPDLIAGTRRQNTPQNNHISSASDGNLNNALIFGTTQSQTMHSDLFLY